MSDQNHTPEVAIYEAQRAHEVELNKATATFEHAVLSPLFLLNGGATVAFLTLLGAASADDSKLDISPVLSGLAAGSWSLGLLAATWAVRKGYESQRTFTQSVGLRRQLLERALLGDDWKMSDVLTPLPSEKDQPRKAKIDRRDDPQAKLQEAQAIQKQYLWFSTLASVWFVVGVILGAFAVLG